MLITVATGNAGSAVLDILASIDADPRVLVHDESKAQPLRERGVESVVGDFLEPQTLGPALEGFSAIFQ